MPESKVEQTLSAIKTQLEAIVGDDGANYWYTPDNVIRVDHFGEKQHFDESFGPVIYMIEDTGDDRPAAAGGGAGFGETSREFDCFVFMAMDDSTRSDKSPFTASTLSGTLRNRMLQDIIKKLEADHHLGGISFNMEHAEDQRNFQEPDNWICAEAYFVVTYDHDFGDP